MMETQKYKTVSVRLCEAEYRALREQAEQEYTTMSGMLRRLINSYLLKLENWIYTSTRFCGKDES